MKTHDQRAGYVLVNLLLLGVAVWLLSSCTTFEKAFRKYGTNVVDTSIVTLKQTVPHDSVVMRLVTDTTTVIKEVRQGRARIIYQRNPNTTTIRADCDSIVVEKIVKVPMPIQKWGVDPVWKDRAERWKTVALVLGVLLLVAIVVYLFTHIFQLSISKRNAPV